MRLRSLRSRLIVGSLLWTLGILAISVALATAVMLRHPNLLAIIHHAMLTIVAVVSVAAGLGQLRRGMSPFNGLRARLAAVKRGEAGRLEGDYPSEIQPLVGDLNDLLEQRERRVARALSQACDLAHGLKTPLAVLAQEAARAEAEGHHELAESIHEQVGRMRRQMDYHLARARAAAGGITPTARCKPRESAEALARTLAKLHADRGLAIDVQVPDSHVVRCRREDLDEMLGNLLDNACAWAASRVVVQSIADASTIVIAVDDDGPGIADAMREAVLQRGVRADEAGAGHGFGLAIVREIAEMHGGSVVIGTAAMGGTSARLTLPQPEG